MEHDKRGHLHAVAITAGTRLADIVGQPTLLVNTFHREAVATLADGVVASSRAEDGVIEAIELPSHPFALGLQWHQELLTDERHPGNRIFRSFVEASGRSRASLVEGSLR